MSMTTTAVPVAAVAEPESIASVPPRSREVGRFVETASVRWLRRVFAMLGPCAPEAAARLAYALLTRPPRVAERTWERAVRSRANCSALRFGAGELALYEWGSGARTVLLVHGWGARGTHFGRMVPALVQAGHRVLAFDAPAHGYSTGRSTTLPDFAASVAAVARHVGGVELLVAHSFGVAMALWAQADWGLRVRRQVLFSSLDHCQWVTEEFGRLMGLPPAIMERGRQLMVQRTGSVMDWDRLSVADWLCESKASTLLMHDTADQEVPVQHLFSLIKACPQRPMDVHLTEGLGHHRLLGDSRVVNRVVDFLG
jgi:pimeloyl-ACP methyl ester carboxylesterase